MLLAAMHVAKYASTHRNPSNKTRNIPLPVKIHGIKYDGTQHCLLSVEIICSDWLHRFLSAEILE